jgi:hypothetical protein
MDTALPDDNGVLVDTYGNERFSRDVIDAFPSLRQDLVSSAGVLHVQMALLGELVRRSLDSGDMKLAKRVCVFLDRTLDEPRVSPEITNAIAISFLVPDQLQATEGGCDLLEQMPIRLRAILLEQAARDREGS